jgi:hypothetical protein
MWRGERGGRGRKRGESDSAGTGTPYEFDEFIFKVTDKGDDVVDQVCPDDEYAFVSLFSCEIYREEGERERTHDESPTLLLLCAW